MKEIQGVMRIYEDGLMIFTETKLPSKNPVTNPQPASITRTRRTGRKTCPKCNKLFHPSGMPGHLKACKGLEG